MSVFEWVKELAIMIATGAGRVHIFVLVWIESVMLALTGGIIGLVFAIIADHALEGMLRKFLPLVPVGEIVTFRLDILLFCMLLTLVIGLIAGLYPAFIAARQKPINVLRAV